MIASSNSTVTSIDVDDYIESLQGTNSALNAPSPSKPQQQQQQQQQYTTKKTQDRNSGSNVRSSISPDQIDAVQHLPVISSVLVQDEEQQQYNAVNTQPQNTQIAHSSAPQPDATSNFNTRSPTMEASVTVVVSDPVLLEEETNPNNATAPKIFPMGQAQPAQLTDFLENRNLQRTLGGILCVVVTLAVLIIVIIFWAQSQQPAPTPSPTYVPSYAPSAAPAIINSPPTNPPTAPTIPPTTLAPTVVPLLLDLPPETVRALRDPFSPQSQAYSWLEDHPNVESLQNFQKEQIMAVLTIYYALNGEESFWSSETSSPKGNWGSHDVPFCDWTPFQDAHNNIHQNENSHMGMCNYQGKLTHLNLHSIQGNVITSHRHGTLAPEIGLLTNLREFEINNCRFGKYPLKRFLPSTMTNLTSLQKLQYVGNSFWGTIPPLPLTNLTLTSLNLDGNALAGAIPSQIGAMTSLGFLSLAWNSLRQAIPSETGKLHARLETLRLYKNRLEGPVPSELAQLTKLKVLELQNNDISGRLPNNLCGELSALTSLRLDCHQLPCPSGCTCNCLA